MKKYVSAALSVILAASLLLAGCGTSSSTGSTGSASTAGGSVAAGSNGSSAASSTGGESTGSISSETGSAAVSGNSSSSQSGSKSSASTADTASKSVTTGSGGKTGTPGVSSTAPASSAADTKAGNGSRKTGKTLVVYYSYTGNTKKLATIIKDLTGADIFEIQSAFDYNSMSRSEVVDLVKKQVEEGFKPELKTKVENLESYDTIFVGSPVWWYAVAPPVVTFLTEENLKGKKVITFCTYGSVLGNFYNHFKSLLPDSDYIEGISVTESDMKNEAEVKDRTAKWLKEINIKTNP